MKRVLGFALLTPLAFSGIAACTGDEPTIGEDGEEVIGGFPATSSAYAAIGSLGIPLGVPVPEANQPDAAFRGRSYVANKTMQLTEGATHFPFCTGTLIAKDVVLTAEHCVVGLQGDEQFLIGFDGTTPERAVTIVGAISEETVPGGIVGFGSDVAVAFLAEPITDIKPLKIGTLAPAQVGKPFVAIGYGMRDNDGTAGQRYLGELKLRGIGGNHALNVWGTFAKYVQHFHELGDLGGLTPEDALPFFELLPEYEASFGNAKNNAQICFGDSGGPITRGKKLTVYGVASAVVQTTEMICDWGSVHATFGPAALDLIDRGLACKTVGVEATCAGDVVQRCAPPVEGGWKVVKTNCATLGLVCGEGADGAATCLTEEEIPEPEPEPVGTCEGNCGSASVDPDGNVLCWCDDACTELGDCCGDFLDFCTPGELGTSGLRP
jgi:hypothetical protein